jgi:predicted Zn-dependent protease
LALGPACLGAQGVTARAARASQQQIRQVGQQAFERIIMRVGRDDDPGANAELRSILERLLRAAGQPSDFVTFAIAADDGLNAMALPGRFMIVNRGIFLAAQSLGRQLGPGASDSARAERVRASVASVVGHELAHLTLGHSDALVRPFAGSDGVRAEVERILRDPALLARAGAQRAQESEADRLGSLYALRAGWAIQDAMDFMRFVDQMERAGGDADVRSVSWVRSHPRASQREANLEAFRAELKLNQGRYDDAVTLIRNGVQVNVAVALLDTVLSYFPGLLAARHARASALQLAWMQSVSVNQLRVQAAVPVYTARFIDEIRGARQQQQANSGLQRARAAFRDVLARTTSAVTLASAAVLDAYGGDLARARARADSAIALDGDDGDVQNNVGVVRYLSGSRVGARDAFQRAQQTSDAGALHARYNLARVLLELGDTAAAREPLREYLELDTGSDWRSSALGLARAAGLAVDRRTDESPTASAVRSLPRIDGVTLGTSMAEVTGAWGAPDARRELPEGRQLWAYEGRAARLVFGPNGEAIALGLFARNSGSVDGARVGDSLNAVLAQWGRPTGGGGGVLFWIRGRWQVRISTDGSTVGEIALGWVS